MISLSMITRDEEQFLPCCLSSVLGMVDELIAKTFPKGLWMKIEWIG
jgi:hypothetical protein